MTLMCPQIRTRFPVYRLFRDPYRPHETNPTVFLQYEVGVSNTHVWFDIDFDTL